MTFPTKIIAYGIGALSILGVLYFLYNRHVESIRNEVLNEFNSKQLTELVKAQEEFMKKQKEILDHQEKIIKNFNEQKEAFDTQIDALNHALFNRAVPLEGTNSRSSRILRDTIKELQKIQ